MLITKLTVPLIKDEILSSCSRCWIAAAGISKEGFKFVFDRIPPSAVCILMTGLDLPTDPEVLQCVLDEFPDRITMKIFSEGFFHPKVFIFECHHFTVAYVGSGNFTMGGFKNNEELFYKLTDENEINTLKVWFNSYFDRSVLLTQTIIDNYKNVYDRTKERDNASRNDLRQFKSGIRDVLNNNTDDLSGQYFTREDYDVLSDSNSALRTSSIAAARIRVRNKLLDLHTMIKPHLPAVGNLYEHYISAHIASSIDPRFQPNDMVRAIWIAYGRSEGEIKRYERQREDNPQRRDNSPMNYIRMQAILRQNVFGVWLMPGKDNGSEIDRSYFQERMRIEQFRNDFYRLLRSLGNEYWINVAEIERQISEFTDAEELWQFTRRDNWRLYYFTIGKNFQPDATEISTQNIVATILNEFRKLYPVYRLIKDKSFE